ncbi:hypothetical protein RAK27_18020 [Carnobacterium maltaromaticum]|uniref:Uncharacterized protein n=1 Tax=Carnobacterium maltaromaticum TaxID=2751 RepID=A0AAW9K9U5_CARML|nr:hypothetical protein [Carnobacterium maltaromaticum]MDZ5760542.1 hypothetical protein [Carnobacterium maltaromaticum]
MFINEGIKKSYIRAAIFSPIVSVVLFLVLIILYSKGFSAVEPVVQWILYFFVASLGIFVSSCISLCVNFIGEFIEKRYNDKFSENILFWMRKEKFGYKYDFSKEIFENYKAFPTNTKNSIEKLEYVRKCFKREYSIKELKMWKLYFDMKRDSTFSITMIISTLFSFSFISFILQLIPKVYDITLKLTDNILLAIMYGLLFILFFLSLLSIVWRKTYLSEKNYKTYYPIICSLLEEYEKKKNIETRK